MPYVGILGTMTFLTYQQNMICCQQSSIQLIIWQPNQLYFLRFTLDLRGSEDL
uniref:Uncharacterized protein n=1 Tax=Moniliophthora roreri TaxID=221103 RepID=A0A0W0FN12_MONRR